MPTYDYACDACGHSWEEFQTLSSSHIEICPKCGAKRARRLLGIGAGMIFKGSGFYSTDYRPACAKSESASSGGGACSAPSGG